MCSPAGINFVASILQREEVFEKRVLEVGSRDVNGGMRGILSNYDPRQYIGVDIEDGPGVDELCNVTNLVEQFGADSFDIVFSTELLEHVYDWRSAISNLKGVLKSDGVLLVTTRSPGFKYHGYPHDYWRYTPGDLKNIFKDFDILECKSDPESPGVFFAARKPAVLNDINLDEYQLHSVITGNQELSVAPEAILRIQRNHKWRTRFRRLILRMVDPILNLIFPHQTR